MSKKTFNMNCQNCGAKVTSEICPYCKAQSGINPNLVNLEYPLLEYETIPKSSISSFLVVTCIFIFIAIVPLMIGFGGDTFSLVFDIVFSGIVAFIYIHLLVKLLVYLHKYKTTQKKGEILNAYVHGFLDENRPDEKFKYSTVKLLVDTKDGKRFILFKLDERNKPYKIGSNVKLKVYNNYCVFAEDEKYYFE